jgi:hypothetical protein
VTSGASDPTSKALTLPMNEKRPIVMKTTTAVQERMAER